MREPVLVMGAVAYAPKVVTIWEGFKAWFVEQGVPFDYVLYSNYERMTEDLIAGRRHVAWNSPLAWVRARRLAAARGITITPLAMRDTDCDLVSVIVVLAESQIHDVVDLAGCTVGVGAPDSPQATLLPLHRLHQRGVDRASITVRVFDVLGGKHGDHVGGEHDAASALITGAVDAACLIETNYRSFTGKDALPSGSTRVLDRTEPFDHCNFTVCGSAPAEAVAAFADLLFTMSYDDPALRPLLELEGLRRWVPARTDGYRALEEAVDLAGFYDANGTITATGYTY